MGTFELGETNPELEELYMEADDFFLEYEYSKSKKKLERILKEDPTFEDAYFMLADIAKNAGDYREAENILNKGVQYFKSIIPEGFNGEIPWGFTGNQPLLRLYHELLITYDQQNKTGLAIEAGQKMLNYNPDDNQGIRWLMGDLYLKNGNMNEAEQFFRKNASQYPPLRYSYALLLVIQNKRWDAITQFRLGFLENIYVSEILSFKAPLIRYAVYEQSNLNGLEIAGDYAMSMTEFWMENIEALQMMDFLKKHPIVYGEINQVFALLQELNILQMDDTFFNSFDGADTDSDRIDINRETRQEIFNDIGQIKKQINKSTSKAILKDLDNLLSDSS